MIKLNLKNYTDFPMFLADFMKERNLTQEQMGECLSYTASYINQMLRGKKTPTDSFLYKFADAFNDFTYEMLISTFLKKDSKTRSIKPVEPPITPMLTKENMQDEPKIETNEEMAVTANQTSLNLNVTPNPGCSNKDLSPKDANILEHLQQHPNFYTLLSNLSNLDDELTTELYEQYIKIHSMLLEEKTAKYTHKEFKQFFLDTNNHWIDMVKLKSYVNNPTKQFDELAIEGHLQLSNSSLFFVLRANEDLLSITTNYQDRHFLNDFVNLVSGVKANVNTRGKLGSIYNDVPLYSILIFNPANFVIHIKSLLNQYDINQSYITFENEFIHSYMLQK